MSQSRKPGWLHRFCPQGNFAKLTATLCSCNQWVIVCSQGVEEKYDAGALRGDDLVIAIILHRPLTRIIWNQALQQPRLVDLYGPINPNGEYLAAHTCRIAAITDRAPTMTRRPKPPELDLHIDPQLIDGFQWDWIPA